MSHSGLPGKVWRTHFNREAGEADASWLGFAWTLAPPGTREHKGPGKLVGLLDGREANPHGSRLVLPLKSLPCQEGNRSQTALVETKLFPESGLSLESQAHARQSIVLSTDRAASLQTGCARRSEPPS